MIYGIGTDIIEISRVKMAVEKNSQFLNKIFSNKELDYLMSRNLRFEYIAGRFAAKEAVSKAIGTGFKGFGMQDIEILSEDSGKPVVNLKEKALALDIFKNNQYKIHLSISHGRDNAVAYAILEVYKNEDC